MGSKLWPNGNKRGDRRELLGQSVLKPLASFRIIPPKKVPQKVGDRMGDGGGNINSCSLLLTTSKRCLTESDSKMCRVSGGVIGCRVML